MVRTFLPSQTDSTIVGSVAGIKTKYKSKIIPRKYQSTKENKKHSFILSNITYSYEPSNLVFIFS